MIIGQYKNNKVSLFSGKTGDCFIHDIVIPIKPLNLVSYNDCLWFQSREKIYCFSLLDSSFKEFSDTTCSSVGYLCKTDGGLKTVDAINKRIYYINPFGEFFVLKRLRNYVSENEFFAVDFHYILTKNGCLIDVDDFSVKLFDNRLNNPSFFFVSKEDNVAYTGRQNFLLKINLSSFLIEENLLEKDIISIENNSGKLTTLLSTSGYDIFGACLERYRN